MPKKKLIAVLDIISVDLRVEICCSIYVTFFGLASRAFGTGEFDWCMKSFFASQTFRRG